MGGELSHFLLLVVGDDPDDQLAIYNMNLAVVSYKDRLPDSEIDRIREQFEVESIDDVVDSIAEWTGYEGGYDEEGFFFWSTVNPRGKFDWSIMGGRWCGYLKLRPGCPGEIGKRGAGVAEDEPLPYGDLSADRALLGDVDWNGMRQSLRSEAEDLWEQAEAERLAGDEWRYKYGIESWMDREAFIEARSHPATFAVLKDSEWYERGNKGWWGLILDAEPVTLWHQQFDELIEDCAPETLLSVIDCHIQGGP